MARWRRCAKAGRWRGCLRLLRRMRDDGVPPTTISYNFAIDGCASVASAGDGLPHCHQHHHRHHHHHLHLLLHHHLLLLHLTSSTSTSPPSPRRLLEGVRPPSLCSRRCEARGPQEPDVVTYTIAITANSRAGDWGRVLGLIGAMAEAVR